MKDDNITAANRCIACEHSRIADVVGDRAQIACDLDECAYETTDPRYWPCHPDAPGKR